MKIVLILFLLLSCITAQTDAQPRQTSDFNAAWKFYLGDAPGANNNSFDDSAWRALNLPHDWSIEGDFSADHPTKAAGGYLPAGIGWYRKTFTIPLSGKNKLHFIEFDGIYQNSEIWINGHSLGKRPYGYISFSYELTPYLKYGPEENVIAVRVDNSLQPSSRWYTGSGIYRNVRLVSVEPVHIPQWGIFITTPEISRQKALIAVETNIKTTGTDKGKVITRIFKDGRLCAVSDEKSFKGDATVIQKINLPNPELWTCSHPALYTAVTQVFQGNKLVDEQHTPFGVRAFHFDAVKGFFLNGLPLKILGVNQHHDLGALGAAVNTRAIQRQLEILKEMGCNAIRTAHNPPAPELLDLCDQMGFLVMDEAFDAWAKKKAKQDYHRYWKDWHVRDLQDMVLRDRNHPSIIMWSIGNEIREQFDSTGTSIARELVDIVKALDKTRPVTCALTENIPEKNYIYQSRALDVLGFNYKEQAYKDFPQKFPGQIMIASENMSALATRGHYDMPSDVDKLWPPAYNQPFDSNADYTVSAYDHVYAYWGSTHEKTWNIVKKYPHIPGLFVWSGFDFIGEPVPYDKWPARSSYYGIIDLAGFPKDAYYMYKSEWNPEPMLHVFPHWNWQPDQLIDIWAYYNQADEAELFLNGISKGIRHKTDSTFHVMWRLNFEPGTVKVITRKSGKVILEKEIFTAGAAAQIKLTADRNTIRSDGKDLSFITVDVLDKDGHPVPDAAQLVNFDIIGPGFIAGVDNGYQAETQSLKAGGIKTFNGKCLLMVQSNGSKGNIAIRATSAGLPAFILNIEAL